MLDFMRRPDGKVDHKADTFVKPATNHSVDYRGTSLIRKRHPI
jgi:hypothetical protein